MLSSESVIDDIAMARHSISASFSTGIQPVSEAKTARFDVHVALGLSKSLQYYVQPFRKFDMTIKELAKKIFLVEILKGMALTLKYMFTHAVTRQYPEEKRDPFPGFRGRHAFVRDQETGKEKCVACLRCATVCPSQCIYIDYSEQGDGSRILEKYEIEALRCVYCGYCVEVCPVCALVLTEFYEYCDYSRNAIYFDRERLLKNWDEFTSKLKADKYFNKFWRPEGINVEKMPVGKRLQQPVSIKAKTS